MKDKVLGGILLDNTHLKDIGYRLYAILLVILMPVIFIGLLISYAIEHGVLKDMAMFVAKTFTLLLRGVKYEE